jgi:broad specificity phosphatase PhoE
MDACMSLSAPQTMLSVCLIFLLSSIVLITTFSFSPPPSSLSSYYCILMARSTAEKVMVKATSAAASGDGDSLLFTTNSTVVAHIPTDMFTNINNANNPILLAPLPQHEVDAIMTNHVAEKQQQNGDFGATVVNATAAATSSSSRCSTAATDATTSTTTSASTTTTVIYGVRHACSIANEYLKQKGNEWGDATFRDDVMLRDARLSDKGFAQVDKLSQRLLRELKESSSSSSSNSGSQHWLNQVELVVVSPLTRCLQTWEGACRPALVAALEAYKQQQQQQQQASSLTTPKTTTTTATLSSLSSSLSSLPLREDDAEKSESTTSSPARRRKKLPIQVIVLPLASERVYTAGETGSSVQELRSEFADDTSSATKTDTLVTDWSAFDNYINDDAPWWYHENDDNDLDGDDKKKIYDEWRPHGQGQYYAVPGEPWEIFDGRMKRFKEWLQQRPETCILVVSHWGVLNHLTGGQDLKNCGLVHMEM